MKTKIAHWLLIGVLAVSSMSIYGCEGGAEKAGEDVDDAVEEMGDKIEDATDKK